MTDKTDTVADPASLQAYGYNTKRTYTQGFFNKYDPRRMSALAALVGHGPPDPNAPFTYADFGSGFGMTAMLLARALPHGQFFAIDFIEEHMTTGRAAAAAMGIENITFIHAGFDALTGEDLPPLDYATAHGVLSWVSGEVRAHLRQCLDRFLKPESLLMASFNHLSGWGDTMAARELLKDAYDKGLDERAVRDLTLDVVKSGVSKGERHYPNMLKSIQKDNLDYLQHELLNNHWTCFTNRQIADEMAEIGLEFLAPWQSPMQARAAADRPLKIEDRIFWEDAFYLRRGASFQYALFARGPRQSPVLSGSVPIPAGHFSLAPGEALPAGSKLAATSLGSRAPFASLSVAELEALFPAPADVFEVMPAVMSRRMVYTAKPMHPTADPGAFTLAPDVHQQLEVQRQFNLRTPTLSLPGVQAVVDLPQEIMTILTRCAGQPPENFAQLLADTAWLDDPAPVHHASVETWRIAWAPWLAGLGAIRPSKP